MAVVKLNEAMLFQMGFDRVAIDALRHLYTQVGSEIGAPTLPQVSEQVVTVTEKIDYLDLSPPYQDPFPSTNGDQAPPRIDAQAVEYLETQVRSMQEEISILRVKINDLEQGAIL